jgi:hypothetical protein
MFKYKCVHHHVCNYIKWWIDKKILKREKPTVNIQVFLDNDYKIGDRIGQLIIIKHPFIEFVESDSLSETDRGNKCFGSTGK